MDSLYHILYADDDEDDLFFVQSAIQQEKDIVLHTFPDGSDLLAFVEGLSNSDKKPCLILLDLNMPLNGKETLRRLKQMDYISDIKMVLFTTSSSARDRQFAAAMNADFITKPINTEQLHKVIGELVTYCREEYHPEK